MFDDNSYKSKMSKTIDVFSKDLSSLRTGRANSNMLDLINFVKLRVKEKTGINLELELEIVN